MPAGIEDMSVRLTGGIFARASLFHDAIRNTKRCATAR
jgi:hypothetical protein